MQAEWEATTRTLAGMTASGGGPAPQAVEEYRQSKDGVRIELYHRVRASDPAVTADEIAAVVTDANAEEVYWQIVEALAGESKS